MPKFALHKMTTSFNSIKSHAGKAIDWWRRMSELKKQPVAAPTPVHDYHTCTHCNYNYHGRCCPQCGMPAGQVRFTLKRLLSNFLDIWGMGNRPMFRTISHLLWRPGYMIRDYLNGHHLSYFPPFKMLAVLSIFIVILSMAFDARFSDTIAERVLEMIDDFKEEKHKHMSMLALEYVKIAITYLKDHDLYWDLFQTIFLVLSAWIVFYRKGYNLVETFFSQIYIFCQFNILTIVWMLCTTSIPPSQILPYTMHLAISFPILIYDFKQLYGIGVLTSVWKTFLFILLTIILYCVVLGLILVAVLALDNI